MFDYEFTERYQIEIITRLRNITGRTPKEAIEFLEHVILLHLEHQSKTTSSITRAGSPEPKRTITHVPITPPMYLVGHSYKQLDKNVVLILGVSNFNTEDETVYSISSEGRVVHRYNRRDFGRVTGTDHNNPDPRNLEVL
jgi:hypothetical protein